jgi:hypothetical protein
MKSKLIITICDNLYVNYKVRQIMNARERNKRHTFEGACGVYIGLIGDLSFS